MSEDSTVDYDEFKSKNLRYDIYGDPNKIELTDPDVPTEWKICVLQGKYFGEANKGDNLGGRISAVFVLLVTSFFFTIFPVLALKYRRLRVPAWGYLIARQFGSGVILATAFIHLSQESFENIGSNSCIGMTGGWGIYTWCPAIQLAGAVITMLIDSFCAFFSDRWFRSEEDDRALHKAILTNPAETDRRAQAAGGTIPPAVSDEMSKSRDSLSVSVRGKDLDLERTNSREEYVDNVQPFYQQLGAFLVLEFGIIFHSVMIGLLLGSSDEYSVLYPVIVFHQVFEGLGIGARMSSIPFPANKKWMPWALAFAYAITTPLACAIGIGVRRSYSENSWGAGVVAGILDALSAGIMFYTSFVELIGKDFIFNRGMTKKLWLFLLQHVALLWGAGIMALVGKWA